MIAACGGPQATTTPTLSPAAAATITPSAAPASASPTLATDDLASLTGEHPQVPPGTWRWTRFEPAILMTVDAGWSIGHRHDNYFDLFRGDTFPAMGFGRFDRVMGASGPVDAASARAVVAALRANPGVAVVDVGPASLAGLAGLTIDLHVSKEQTPLFRGAEGNFNFDPAFVARYYLLDVEGGVLMISIATFDGQLEAALALADPVLASLRITSER